MDTPLPLPAARALRQLGQNISRARRRRRMSQDMLAERIGASVTTVRRMEAGYPGAALQHLARVLLVFGDLGKLSALLDIQTDDVGLALMDEHLPQRVRKPKRSDASGAL